MNDELKQLQRAYQNIKAPAWVATRVRAEIAPRGKTSQRWFAAVATAAVAVSAVWLLPLLQQQSAQHLTTPQRLTLSRLMNDKPSVSTPSLSQLRSVKVPPLPSSPARKRTKDPQTYYPINNDPLKENYHA